MKNVGVLHMMYHFYCFNDLEMFFITNVMQSSAINDIIVILPTSGNDKMNKFHVSSKWIFLQIWRNQNTFAQQHWIKKGLKPVFTYSRFFFNKTKFCTNFLLLKV